MDYRVRPSQLTREQVLADAQAQGAQPWQVVASALAGRYSCRGFRAEPIPRETLQRIISLAQLSGSWCNSQPWQTIVTEGAATERFRQALFAFAEANEGASSSDFPLPAQYEGIYKTRRRETAWQLYEAVGVKFGDRVASRVQTFENYRLFGAPHVMIITTEADLGLYGAVDCGIYIGNLLTLAQAMGLATIAQAALARLAPFIRSFFGLPESRRVLCGISVGYANDCHPANSFRTTRAPLDEVARFVTE
jgi:nitroreductase